MFDHKFFLLINVAVGGAFSQRPDVGVRFPQIMLIDDNRVFTRSGTLRWPIV